VSVHTGFGLLALLFGLSVVWFCVLGVGIGLWLRLWIRFWFWIRVWLRVRLGLGLRFGLRFAGIGAIALRLGRRREHVVFHPFARTDRATEQRGDEQRKQQDAAW
jgi:hypothetical protein